MFEYPFYQLLLNTLRFATGTGISQSLTGKAVQTLTRLLGSEEKKKKRTKCKSKLSVRLARCMHKPLHTTEAILSNCHGQKLRKCCLTRAKEKSNRL